MVITNCKECQEEQRIYAKGLCQKCYQKKRYREIREEGIEQ